MNGYIKEILEDDFSAKDFRTWAGTVLAAAALAKSSLESTSAQTKRNVTAAIEAVASRLGNTPAICRKCYVHPDILGAYTSDDLKRVFDKPLSARLRRRYAGLNVNEGRVLALLEQRSRSAQ